MFLRKLLGSSNEKNKDSGNGPPAGMQTMGPTLQRKFAKGVQYNMKIIIKGDRNVGKSCLFYRLQGQKFKEEYLPTDEIQVTSIQWNYKATDDVVKVEVWDVVDKGKKKKKLEGLKLTANDDGYEDACLDAEFINVYKGTHGVIIVMDITKHWTYDYVVRELPKIPANLPVLILANHRDMGHHRTVIEDKVRYYIEELDRGKGAAQVRYAEASMRNGFGLKYIHKFFNLPFLQLQRETLLKQLETNTREIELTNEELVVHEESEEQNYDLFIDQLSSKRREQAEKLAEDALKDAKSRQDEEKAAALAAAEAEARKMSKSVPATPASTPMAPPASGPLGLAEAPSAKPIPGMSLPVSTRSPSPNPTTTTTSNSVSAPTTPATTSSEKTSGGFMSRLFSKSSSKEEEKAEAAVTSTTKPVGNIDDFAPEEGLDASFLDDVNESKGAKSQQHNIQEESSSDEEGGNPLVAGFQDDLDSEDELATPATVTVATDDIELSSEEEEQNSPAVPDQPTITADQDYEQENDKIKVPITNKNRLSKGSRTPSPKATRNKAEIMLTPAAKNARTLANDMTKARSDTLDSNSVGSDTGNQVTVLQDVEEVSENVDEGHQQAVENIEEESSNTCSALQFEDLGVLEKGFDFNTGMLRAESVGSDMVSSSRQDTDTDGDASSSAKKKKKHRSKEKEKSEGDRSHKKKKKHKDRDREKDSSEGLEKEKKKKRKSKKKDNGVEKKEIDELEAFLGGGDVASPTGGGYESL